MAFKSVNKVFVGANIARTALLELAPIDANIAMRIAEGEVTVLNSSFAILGDAHTNVNSRTIYIAMGGKITFKEGLLNHRNLIVSDPINDDNVTAYFKTNYAAAVNQVLTLNFGTFTAVAGEEYVVRVIYKDLYQHPGMFSQTYRHIAVTGALTKTAVTDAFVALITADKKARVTAANAGDTLVLTAKPIPGATTKVTIDNFSRVEFDAVMFSGNFASDATRTYTTAGFNGHGTAALVRDAEKAALSHKGITNRTNFPVPSVELDVNMSLDYDAITIHANVPYVSADNQYIKSAPISVSVYFPTGATQKTAILTPLNSWMNSIGFASIAW